MNKSTKKFLLTIAKIVGSVAIVLLLWWMFAAVADNPLVLPSPWEVLKLTFVLLGQGSTYLALLLTLARATVAFAFSATVALCLTLLVGVCTKTAPYVDGVVTFFRALPTVAIILLTMVAFQSTTVPVVVAFLVAFPIIYSAFQREITADAQLLNLCKVFNLSSAKKVKYILLPQIRRAVLPQCKDGWPLCIKVVVAGEVLALPRLGLGREMYVAKVNLMTANVLALTLLALVVCFVISGVFALCKRRAKW